MQSILCLPLLMVFAGCGAGNRVSGDVALPTIALTATPNAVLTGATSVLSVTATNATQVTVSGSDGSSLALQPTGGTQTLSPSVTTTYTGVAVGPGGKVSGSTTITVSPTVTPVASPTVTINATPTQITLGASSVLSVVATNATQVVITGTDGGSYTLQPTGGTQIVMPAKTTTYTAVATGPGGVSSGSILVTVGSLAPTISITAKPNSISAGASSLLVVLASNATQVTLTGSDGTTYPQITASGGSVSVAPTTTTTYTAVATGTGVGNTISQSAVVTVVAATAPTVSIIANPTAITAGNASVLTIVATNSTQVTVSGTDGSTYTLPSTGGTQNVSPATTSKYTATATGASGTATASQAITVTPAGSLQSVGHVVFMLQENHSFDNYFGMLNPYRRSTGRNVGDDGLTYDVDGIDDKLTTISNPADGDAVKYPLFKFTSTCIDDLTSSWLESYGDVSRYDFTPTRKIAMDGFIHTAASYASDCQATAGATCSGSFTDFSGQRSMGYYDEGFLNYYYYLASQFAVSDRWFSPTSSKSIPNRIATFTGGTTQGLAFDPGNNDHLPQLEIPNIFAELDQSKVSWKIYYTVTQGSCLHTDDCLGGASAQYPAINFTYLTYSFRYLYENPSQAACVAPTQSSTVVGDESGSFCIDPTHIAPIASYFDDLKSGLLPSFAFIEAGYGNNDEHPGSGQSILSGQQQVASIVNAFMVSPMWKDSIFFLAYDEGGGPYDHVPPVPNHSNDNTAATVGSTPVASIPDISSIAVNADSYIPCVPSGGVPTLHCDLVSDDPGAKPTDAPAIQGFAAQLGFRIPNLVISPFTRRHYVSHIPMDHTAVMKFVETRFVTDSTNLTPHEAAQPNLLDFFDFSNTPWATPPTPPAPVTNGPNGSLGYDSCTPTKFMP